MNKKNRKNRRNRSRRPRVPTEYHIMGTTLGSKAIAAGKEGAFIQVISLDEQLSLLVDAYKSSGTQMSIRNAKLHLDIHGQVPMNIKTVKVVVDKDEGTISSDIDTDNPIASSDEDKLNAVITADHMTRWMTNAFTNSKSFDSAGVLVEHSRSFSLDLTSFVQKWIKNHLEGIFSSPGGDPTDFRVIVKVCGGNIGTTTVTWQAWLDIGYDTTRFRSNKLV